MCAGSQLAYTGCVERKSACPHWRHAKKASLYILEACEESQLAHILDAWEVNWLTLEACEESLLVAHTRGMEIKAACTHWRHGKKVCLHTLEAWE